MSFSPGWPDSPTPARRSTRTISGQTSQNPTRLTSPVVPPNSPASTVSLSEEEEEEENMSIGSSLSEETHLASPQVYQMESNGFGDNWKLVKAAMNTGRLLLDSRGRAHSPTLENILVMCTLNLPAAVPQMIMYGRKQHESLEHSLNSDKNLLFEAIRRIGMPSGLLLDKATWKVFLPTFEYVVITRSEELATTLCDQFQWLEKYEFTGGRLALERVEEPGKKPESRLTLRTHKVSIGAVIKVKRMLSSMSLEEESAYLICCDGLIGIRLTIKIKEPESQAKSKNFGLPAICIRKTGSLSWTKQPLPLYFEG